MAEGQPPSPRDVIQQLGDNTRMMQRMEELMASTKIDQERIGMLEATVERQSAQIREALGMAAKSVSAPGGYDPAAHDLPHEKLFRPKEWEYRHFCSDLYRDNLIGRLEHEIRKQFGNSKDPGAVAGDAISLRESLDTISKHLQDCGLHARAGRPFSMVSVEPAFENLHYLRYKHKFGREYGRYWKETARSAPMDDQYTQAHEATMSYYQNMSIAQGAAMNAKNGGGRGYGERFRGPFRGVGRARGGRGMASRNGHNIAGSQ